MPMVTIISVIIVMSSAMHVAAFVSAIVVSTFVVVSVTVSTLPGAVTTSRGVTVGHGAVVYKYVITFNAHGVIVAYSS